MELYTHQLLYLALPILQYICRILAMNSFSLCPWKCLYFTLIVKEDELGNRFLVNTFPSTLNMSCHCLLPSVALCGRSAVNRVAGNSNSLNKSFTNPSRNKSRRRFLAVTCVSAKEEAGL